MNIVRGVPPQIALDFFPQRKPPGIVGWFILAAGVITCLAVVIEYFDLKDSLADAEQRLAREERVVNRQMGQALAKSRDKVPEAELRQASQIAQELRRPWLTMLAEIEAAGDGDIALLSVETQLGKAGTSVGVSPASPVVNSASIKLAGEARSLEALFAYAHKLGAQPSLSSAQVESYEFKKSGAVEVVVFKMSARWRADT